MEVLYVTDESYKIQKSSDTLIVRQRSKKVASIPLVHLKSVVIFGRVQLSTQVIHMLMISGINIFYYDNCGSVLGVVLSNESDNILLRISQFRLWQDFEYKLNFSKEICKRKIRNQIQLLKNHSRNKMVDSSSIKLTVEFLLEQVKLCESAVSVQGVMGYEGVSAKAYFEAYGLLISKYSFRKRQRRPAKDIVNALLNYGYAFLKNEFMMRLSAYGFDVELGFMHGVRYGRDSLALDLMDPFRPLFVDALVIKLLNSSFIDDNSYIVEDGACILTKEGIKIFCEQYEIHMYKVESKGNWFQIFDREIKLFRSNILASNDHTTLVY